VTALTAAAILLALLLVLLVCGVWIAIALAAAAWAGLAFFTSTPPELSLFQAFWGSSASWTLAALPLFVWMGEILYRTRLSQEMFEGLAPWLTWLPGRLMHVNILGCALFGTVSGSSAATCATIAKVALPELKRRGYDERTCLGSLCGAGTLGILLPPSIIMIVYAVAAEVSIIKVFLAGIIPGVILTVLFSGYIALWALAHPDRTPRETMVITLREKRRAHRIHRVGDGDRLGDRYGSGSLRSSGGAGHRVAGRGTRSQDVLAEPDGRNAPLVHDHVHPRRRVLPGDLHGVHRYTARARRVGGFARAQRLRPDRGPGPDPRSCCRSWKRRASTWCGSASSSYCWWRSPR
jgi:hypothetical protein